MNLWEKIAATYQLSPERIVSLQQFVGLLQKWNQAYRLVGDASLEVVLDKHIADSLAVCSALVHNSDGRAFPPISTATHENAVQEDLSVIDLGSGAGLPGLVVKIARPDLRITLVDPLSKRMQFCHQVRRTLQLDGVEIIEARAEDNKLIEQNQKFDYVISRATWKLSEYVRLALPYLHADSVVIAMKGAKVEQEVEEAARELNIATEQFDITPYSLPLSHITHFLVKVPALALRELEL